MPETVDILGVPVHNVSEAEALALIAAFADSGRPHQAATVNPEFIVRARREPEFMAALRGADLCLADGVGVVWAARLLGRPLKGRVAGSDLVWRIADRAATDGRRLYLLGAREGVAARAAERLVRRFPALQVAGTFAGSPRREEEEAIVARVWEARADVLLVAYGAPAQDTWLARNLARTGASFGMGVGGSFDFVAGVAVRAPRWVQRLGLEWLHRLVREPWRWRRMLALPQFAWLVLMEKRKKDSTRITRTDELRK